MCQKKKIPFQAVINKLQVTILPSQFSDISILEKRCQKTITKDQKSSVKGFNTNDGCKCSITKTRIE